MWNIWSRNIYFRLSGIKDGISASEKQEFLISVGGRDTVRRIYSILPDLFGIDAHLFEFTWILFILILIFASIW